MVGTLRLKSNGESKIAESKAALCCGFAIALRALFLGILCSLIASRKLAMTQYCAMFIKNWRCDLVALILSLREALASWQATVPSIQRRLIASLTLAMTQEISKAQLDHTKNMRIAYQKCAQNRASTFHYTPPPTLAHNTRPRHACGCMPCESNIPAPSPAH